MMNIVVILADQLRADCVGCYGNTVIRTPNIDALAAAGTRFDAAFCQHPQCAPSRGSLLTGRYPHVTGGISNFAFIGDHERTIGEVLRERGYRSIGVGKLHMSDHSRLACFSDTTLCGGQHSGSVTPDGLAPDYKKFLQENGYWEKAREAYAYHGTAEYIDNFRAAVNPIPAEAYFDAWAGDQAVNYIRQQKPGEPFFMFAGFPNPHIPFDAPEPYASLYDPADVPIPATFATSLANKPPQHEGYRRHGRKEDFANLTEEKLRRCISLYYGSITLVDDQVGKLMNALEETNLLDDTVVVFLSDHGELLGSFGMLIKSIDEYPMLYDVGVRVPLIVRVPDGVAATVVQQPVELVDLMPTVLDCANQEIPPEVQGHSQKDALFGGEPVAREYVFCETGSVKMLRSAHHKLVYYPGQTYGELYDLRSDPDEADNLYGQPLHASLQQRMLQALLDRLISQEGPLHGASLRGPAYWRTMYELPYRQSETGD